MRKSFHQIQNFGQVGNEALEDLLEDESVYVKGWIAGALMIEGNFKARGVLEEISKISGITGFNAKITLEEYDKGNLIKAFPKSK